MNINGTVGEHWDMFTNQEREALLSLVRFSANYSHPEWLNIHMGTLCFVKLVPALGQVYSSVRSTGGLCSCDGCTKFRPVVTSIWRKFECEELLEALAKS
jgi:hypothetical protein